MPLEILDKRSPLFTCETKQHNIAIFPVISLNFNILELVSQQGLLIKVKMTPLFQGWSKWTWICTLCKLYFFL